MLYTVGDLKDGAKGVSIRVRIILKEQLRKITTKDGVEHVVVEALAGDRTGLILLSLWDKWAEEVNEQNIIDITNGYVIRFKGKLRLNVGQYGSIEIIQDPDFPIINKFVSKTHLDGKDLNRLDNS